MSLWAIFSLAQQLLLSGRQSGFEPVELPNATLGVELLRLTRRCRGIDKYVSSSAGLTIDEMHCLSVLLSEQPHSVTQLSELINVRPSRASKVLKGLEERGYVSRALHSLDRRKETVMLTEPGVRVAEGILTLFVEVGMELLGGWRKENAADFSRLVRTVTHTECANTNA